MGLFSRKDRSAVGTAEEPDVVADEPVDETPVQPVVSGLGTEERERIAGALAALEAAGVDLDDLEAIGRAVDDALAGWLAQPDATRPDPHDLIDRLGIGIGEHLVRRTDLRWSVVTDAFGTDLAVQEGRGGFVVVPMNLVAMRWLKRESGWVPGVVGHLVALRGDGPTGP